MRNDYPIELTQSQYIRRVIRTETSRALNHLIDSYFGIDAEGSKYADEMGYEGTDFYDYIVSTWWGLFRVFQNVNVEPGEAFLDVGCGKGRPLIAALHLPFEKIIGIDRSPEMIRTCRDNLARYMKSRPKDKERVEIFCTDALAVDFPSNIKWIMLHCPFGEKTTSQFIKNLSADSPPGIIRNIIAINPLHLAVLNDYFTVKVEKSWGGGWFKIYQIEKS